MVEFICRVRCRVDFPTGPAGIPNSEPSFPSAHRADTTTTPSSIAVWRAHPFRSRSDQSPLPRLKEVAKTLDITLKKDTQNIDQLVTLINAEIESVLQTYSAKQFQDS